MRIKLKFMASTTLNYRIILSPDAQTGTGKKGYTAFCPTLGVADDGDTPQEALDNVIHAIEVYVQSLAEDGELIPEDPKEERVTQIQIQAPIPRQLA